VGHSPSLKTILAYRRPDAKLRVLLPKLSIGMKRMGIQFPTEPFCFLGREESRRTTFLTPHPPQNDSAG